MIRPPAVRRLRPDDRRQLGPLLDRDPTLNVYLRSQLLLEIEPADWWGVFQGAHLRGVCQGGALAVPCIPDLTLVAPVARTLVHGIRPRHVVGPREQVLAMHQALAHELLALHIRDPQPVLALDRGGLVDGAHGADVRRSSDADVAALAEAAMAMHVEEVGVDPYEGDIEGWQNRMAAFVERAWSWVWMESGEVIFKTELSAWTPEVVQIQGVYTAPPHRGRGVARAGLTAVCAQLLETVPRCTLYVNEFNVPALRLYERMGFKPVGSFATVVYAPDTDGRISRS